MNNPMLARVVIGIGATLFSSHSSLIPWVRKVCWLRVEAVAWGGHRRRGHPGWVLSAVAEECVPIEELATRAVHPGRRVRAHTPGFARRGDEHADRQNRSSCARVPSPGRLRPRRHKAPEPGRAVLGV